MSDIQPPIPPDATPGHPAIQVQVQPTPVQYVLNQVQLADGSFAVKLDLHTCTGVCCVFLPGEFAQKLADQLAHLAQSARVGLLQASQLPQMPDVGGNGGPHLRPV